METKIGGNKIIATVTQSQCKVNWKPTLKKVLTFLFYLFFCLEWNPGSKRVCCCWSCSSWKLHFILRVIWFFAKQVLWNIKIFKMFSSYGKPEIMVPRRPLLRLSIRTVNIDHLSTHQVFKRLLWRPVSLNWTFPFNSKTPRNVEHFGHVNGTKRKSKSCSACLWGKEEKPNKWKK